MLETKCDDARQHGVQRIGGRNAAADLVQHVDVGRVLGVEIRSIVVRRLVIIRSNPDSL